MTFRQSLGKVQVGRDGYGGWGGCLAGDKWHQALLPLSCNLHLPLWMNGGQHKDCHNNIQALRRKGKGGHLVTNVMDKGMTYRVIVVWMVLCEEKKVGVLLCLNNGISFPKFTGIETTILSFLPSHHSVSCRMCVNYCMGTVTLTFALL